MKGIKHITISVIITYAILTCVFVAVGPCLLAPCAFAQNKTITVKKEAVNQLNKDIKFLDSRIKETDKKRRNTLSELNLYHKKAEKRRQLIAELEGSIREQNSLIATQSRRLQQLTAQIDTLKARYRIMVKKAYKNRDNRTWFIYVLAGENIEQGYRRWSYLKNYFKALGHEARKIKACQLDLEKEQAKVLALKSEKERIRQTQTAEYQSLKAEEGRQRALASTLEKQRSKLKAQLSQKQKEAARLNREIEKMVKAYSAAAPKTPANLKLSGAFESNKGRLPWPVKQGVIVEGFGVNKHPTLKNVNLPFNNGVNISAPRGCAVMAVYEGVVKQIILIPGYSNCVLVEHGKFFTFYCKLGKVSVRSGQKVALGQTLGTLDTQYDSSELHFELWNGKQKQNPVAWLQIQN